MAVSGGKGRGVVGKRAGSKVQARMPSVQFPSMFMGELLPLLQDVGCGGVACCCGHGNEGGLVLYAEMKVEKHHTGAVAEEAALRPPKPVD